MNIKDIEGNKQMNQTIKIIITINITSLIIRIKSIQNKSIQFIIKIKWETEWKMRKENIRCLRNMNQHPDIITRLKLYETLKLNEMILISRLRTGHCYLNQCLHQFNIIETPECEYNEKKETIIIY